MKPPARTRPFPRSSSEELSRLVLVDEVAPPEVEVDGELVGAVVLAVVAEPPAELVVEAEGEVEVEACSSGSSPHDQPNTETSTMSRGTQNANKAV
jgi:hypothetical protein